MRSLEVIMKTFGYAPEELLVVDDLKPGFDMARAAIKHLQSDKL
mgnify:CR=1 FL=1